MAAEDREIELKFPLKNAEEVTKFLEANAKSIAKDVFQKDTYYTPAHRDFRDKKYPFEWLRLRESPKGFSLNYKHFYPEDAEKTDYCDEFETKVENIDAVKKIFTSIDIKEIIIVEKKRSTWEFKDVEIAIDDVKKLGKYIELEALNHFEDPKQGKEYLYSILKELNAEVDEEDLRGYPFKILKEQGYKFSN